MKRSLATLGLVVVLASPAAAHGDLRSSDPAAGSRLQEPPTVVELELAEPPTRESRFFVFDGCDEMLINDIQSDGGSMRLALDPGQPGLWRVEYRVVSAVDGHLVRGDFAFRVAGRVDCSDPAATEDPDPDPEETGGGVAGPPGDDPEADGPSPLIPIVAVGGGIVLVTFFIRKMMAA